MAFLKNLVGLIHAGGSRDSTSYGPPMSGLPMLLRDSAFAVRLRPKLNETRVVIRKVMAGSSPFREVLGTTKSRSLPRYQPRRFRVKKLAPTRSCTLPA